MAGRCLYRTSDYFNLRMQHSDHISLMEGKLWIVMTRILEGGDRRIT